MARLVGVAGLTHNPLMWSLLRGETPDDLADTARYVRSFREKVVDLAPDVIVMVASDHLHMLVTSNMPAFMIGKSPTIRAVHPNEERTFGLQPAIVEGHPALAKHLLGGAGLSPEFDFSFSDEAWLDHSFVVPLLLLTPDLDIPVVPVFTNANSPPIPGGERFAKLGSYLAGSIASAAGDERVLVVGSGHLAFELGGPRQFLGASPDRDFDETAVSWMARGDLDGAVTGATFERLTAAGNETYQFLNFITCLAVAGSRPARVAAGPESHLGALPFFWWDGP
jgi:aromatic ring-opening dioxygenase catalytic subunit (LigB family)